MSETQHAARREVLDVDPVTLEVIRHRLLSINDEQAAALKAVSGSPIVSEADDYNTGIYRARGELVAMGRTVIYHAASMSEMVKHVITDCADDPGIHDGDAFIVNSPWKGALHAADVAILEPIFHDGAHIAWAGATAHQIDIGGQNYGGFAPGARDVHQEGLLIPPVKIVEAGKPRTDVWRMITGMSRLPEALSLNLRGMLAANRVGRRELIRLIDRYGINVVLSVMDALIDISEERLRERLRELPDGNFRSRAYLDHDGHENNLLTVEVQLTKTNDTLHFDYSKSSRQAAGFVNCTRTGLLAGVYAGLLPILAYDLLWNEGIFRCVNITAPSGLIVTAEPPAPCSQAPLGAIWLTEMTSTESVSRLMATHPQFIAEAQALPAGGVDLFNPSGIDQYGEYNGWLLLDNMITGGGAYTHRDGLDPQGHRCITACRVPNVETQERVSPVLYLYRGLVMDSGGPGRERGGASGGAAVTLHNVYWLNGLAGGHGFEVPNAKGIFGGFPAKTNRRRLVRSSDLQERFAAGELPASPGEVQGDEEYLPAKVPHFSLHPGDVYEFTPQAGGGWGDPLSRPPDEVKADVDVGLVSADVAKVVYGVVLATDGSVDESGTREMRSATIAERVSWPIEEQVEREIAGGVAVALAGDRMSVVMDDLGARHFVCSCGCRLGAASESWKGHVCASDVAPADLGGQIALHEELRVRCYACPSCGAMLDVEVLRLDEQPLFEMELDPNAQVEFTPSQLA